jgi:hypothetical protein
MKNAVFLDVTPCDSSWDRRFGGTYCLLHHSGKNQRASNDVISSQQLKHTSRLLVTANVVPSLLNLYTLMMEAKRSYETSVLTATPSHIP